MKPSVAYRVALVSAGVVSRSRRARPPTRSLPGQTSKSSLQSALRARNRRTAAGEASAQLFGDRLHVRVDAPAGERDVTEVLTRAGLPPAHVRPILPSLEDVFIHLLSRQA